MANKIKNTEEVLCFEFFSRSTQIANLNKNGTSASRYNILSGSKPKLCSSTKHRYLHHKGSFM